MARWTRPSMLSRSYITELLLVSNRHEEEVDSTNAAADRPIATPKCAPKVTSIFLAANAAWGSLRIRTFALVDLKPN